MISVIICTYNRDRVFEETVRSFLDCQCDGIENELLLMNNNSTDKTKEIGVRFSEQYPKRIRYINEALQGHPYAKNRGILESCGEIVAFVDDDVYFSPLWLKAIASAFERNQDFGCLGGKVEPYFESPRPNWIKDDFIWIYGITRYGEKEREIYPPEIPIGCNMAFRREVIKKIGGFPTSLGRKPGILLSGDEDYFLLRAKKAGFRTLYSPEAKIYHRIPLYRTAPKWILSRFYWQGVSDSTMRQIGDKPLSRASLVKKIIWILRSIMPAWRSIAILMGSKLEANKSNSIKYQREVCYQLGLLRQMIAEVISAPK